MNKVILTVLVFGFAIATAAPTNIIGGQPGGSSQTGGQPGGSSQTGGQPGGSSQTGGQPGGSSQTGGQPGGSSQVGGNIFRYISISTKNLSIE